MKKNKENGQATFELILMLLAITSCVLGVLFVGAITVSNNDRLLESKFEAEKKSKQNNPFDIITGLEYSHWSGSAYLWNFLRRTFGASNLNLPFGLDYSYQKTSVNTLESLNYRLNNPGDSRIQNQYHWEETNLYNTRFSSSLTTSTGNAFNAAQLVGSHSFSTQNDKDLNDFTDAKTRKTAKSWLGITVNNSDIRHNPSNHVYMPMIKENKKTME